ncbi:MAG: MATE family efflux transporter [Myxococcota bacterium]
MTLENASSAEPRSAGGLAEVATLAAPLVLTQMLITTMGVVDSAIVGRLGAAPLGAVGLGGMWVWTMASFFVGASTAVQTFVAQHHGAGDARACGPWSWQGLAAALPLAALASLIIFFSADAFIEILAPSEKIAPLATGYMRARSLGILGITAAVSLSSFFRGIGDARTPLIATLIANAANLFLDFGLVYGWFGFPKYGVVGAGLATAISEWIYFGVVAFAFMRPAIRREFNTEWTAPRLSEIRRLLRTGIPIGGQWVIEMIAFAVFTTLVARMGDAELAASHAFIQLLSLSFMQASGISTAAATLVGRYVGAGQLEKVRRSYHASLSLGGMLAGVIALLFVFVPETLLKIFTDDPQVLALGAPLLRVGAAYQLFDAISIVIDGALRGAGDTRWPFAMRCLATWLIFIPLAYFLAFPMGFGLTGAWSGGLVSMAVIAGALLWRFHSGAWQRIEI